MSWRSPEENEPPSTPIYVRLGMTKGAMIAFGVIVLIIIGGFFRLESIAADQRKTIRAVRAQQRQNLSALREVCRQGDTILGLTKPLVNLLAFDVAHGTIPKAALPVYTRALGVVQGYATVLREQPACRKITKP